MKKHSSHIFLFPFSFIGDFKTVTGKIENEGQNWHILNSIENNVDQYNQHVFFHDFAEDVLFKFNDTVRCYEFKEIGEDSRYYIYIKGEDRLFNLSLIKITLHIYNTTVGVLSFFLDNYTTDDKEDILKINDFGRRIFPQFLTNGENPIHVCQSNFLASSITITREAISREMIVIPDPLFMDNDKVIITYEDFSFYASTLNNKGENRFHKQVKLASHIIKILGDTIFCDESEFDSDFIRIKPIIDDRMFVICGYVEERLMTQLKQFENKHYAYELFDSKKWIELSVKELEGFGNGPKLTHDEKEVRSVADFWYRFIFIDTNQATSQSAHHITKLINKHTYDRWVNWGTLYGVSRYSFVLLTSSQFEFDNKLNKHLTNLYFNIVLLCIVERSSVLQFSEKVSNASGFTNPKKITKAEIDRISTLYYNYINFINRIYLREITAQEQGIELYDMLMDKMNIKLEVENLDNEISELHTYVSMIEDRKRNIKMAELNSLAMFFLPASLIASILGIGFISINSSLHWFGTLEPKVAKSLLLILIGGLITSGLLWLLLNAGSCIKKVSSIFSKK